MPAKKTSSKSTASKSTAAAASPATTTKATKAASSGTAKKSSGKSAKSSGKSTKAAASTSTPAPAPAPVAAPEPVVAESSTVSTTPEVSLEARFESILTRLAEFKTFQATLHADVKVLRREVTRQMREANRRRTRRPATADDATRTPRAPSGFAKPTLISDELCSFLGKPVGTEMARTEVTKSITAYIKEHSLQHAENKRRIMPDTALASLLNVDDSVELTYFNLQKYMKVHFPKSAAAAPSSA